MIDDISNIPLFSDIDKTELESFKDLFKVRNFKKNHMILFENDISDHVYFIKSGTVKVFRMHNGKEIIISIISEGEILGETEIFSSEKNNISSAEALEDTSTYVISKKDFFDLTQKYPSLVNKAYEILANRLRLLNRLVRYLSFYNVRTRIANILLDFCYNIAEQVDGQHVINKKINQSLIANMVGLTRESVSKTLNEFQNENIIKINSSNITIIDIKKLEDISEQDEEEAYLRKWFNF